MPKSKVAVSTPQDTTGNFDSLTLALESYFDSKEEDLPETLRIRVEEEYYPVPWNMYPAEQRRRIALELDYQKDSATESARQLMWCLVSRQDEIKTKITQCELAATPTASAFESKVSMLKKLHQESDLVELEITKFKRQQALVVYYPERYKPNAKTKSTTQADFIPYPKAKKILLEKWKATADELAAWVFLGPKNGGITAYLNDNKQSSPTQVIFAYYTGCENYSSLLMSCWFFLEEIEQFEPTDRYITGAELINRWKKYPDLQQRVFINAKIADSRLIDLHPTFGGARSTLEEMENFISLESGLFAMSNIKQIEAEELEVVAGSKSTESPNKGGRKKLILTEAIEKAYLYLRSQGNVTLLQPKKIRLFLVELKLLANDNVAEKGSEIWELRTYLSERIKEVKIPRGGGRCSVLTHDQREGKNIVIGSRYIQDRISKILYELRNKHPLPS